MAAYKFPVQDTQIPNITDLVSPLMNQLLVSRGITDAESAKAWLEPDYDSQLHAAQLLNDIEPACVRIEKAMAASEQIAIFSDYDCDGIPGAVVLHDFFKAIKYEHFQNYKAAHPYPSVRYLIKGVGHFHPCPALVQAIHLGHRAQA